MKDLRNKSSVVHVLTEFEINMEINSISLFRKRSNQCISGFYFSEGDL